MRGDRNTLAPVTMARALLDVLPINMCRHVLHFSTSHTLDTLFLVSRSFIAHAHELLQSQHVWLESADCLRWNSRLERYQACLKAALPTLLGPRARKKPLRLIQQEDARTTRAPRPHQPTTVRYCSHARPPPLLGCSQRVGRPPQRFTPIIPQPKPPSRAARTGRRQKRFDIPSPPASPVHSPISASSSEPGDMSSHEQLDLESFTAGPPLQKLREQKHSLRQASANNPHFPVSATDAISQIKRLADLSHSATQSGQVPLVHMATQFDFHSCSLPGHRCPSPHITPEDSSTDDDTHTAPGDAFQPFHIRACTPLHRIMHGFGDTAMAYPTLTGLWKKYAHAHTWHTWGAVPAAGAAHFIDTYQAVRTQLTALQDNHTKLWTPTKNWIHAWDRFLTWTK